MARPSFKATQEQRKMVRFLAAIGQRQEHIAVAVGLRSPKTLRKHFRADILKGAAEAMAKVTAAAYAMAVSGNFPGMTRFWLNTVGGGPTTPVDEAEPEDSVADEVPEVGDAEDQI